MYYADDNTGLFYPHYNNVIYNNTVILYTNPYKAFY